MFKFMRRTVILVAVVGVAGFLVFGAGLPNVIRTGYKQVKKQVESSIPTEFEIHRIEDLIEDLGPEMKQIEHLVAEEQVMIRELEGEIAQLASNREKKTNDLKVIRASLDTPTAKVHLGGLTYSRAHVKSDLIRRLDNLKALDGLIASKERLLKTRQRALESAKSRMLNFGAERTRLLAVVQSLRAELREQKSLEASALDVNIDDSRLKQAKALADKVRRKLEINKTKLENRNLAAPSVEIPAISVEPVPAPRDVVKEVDVFIRSKSDETFRAEATPQLTRN